MSSKLFNVPELSIPVKLEELADGPRKYEFSADPEECAALADRFGLVALNSLSARTTLEWVQPDTVLRMTGRFLASVTQKCVITLSPFDADIDDEISILFARDVSEAADIVDPDEAEPLEGTVIDIGDIVAEELSLSLDPYPRNPAADPSDLVLGPGVELITEDQAAVLPKGENPFSVLESLKPKG
jgi:uncharacterized metal-binding protein YceD (DUF177 family)